LSLQGKVTSIAWLKNLIVPTRKGYIKKFTIMTSNYPHTPENQQATRTQATHPSHNGLGQKKRETRILGVYCMGET
jgi:hypothetical protein